MLYNGSMTENSCCFVKTFPIVLFALFQIGCMNYRFKELSDNVYVVTLRQGNSETWIIPGYGLNVDSRKNGKVYLSFEGEIAEFVKGRRLRAWRFPW